jgi:UDP-N-acetylmuramate: L-alanyl-gamma-D-glutamyl-meso-diaminopimelate ligase
MRPGSHVHLIGVCGTAMASLAGLLQLRGHRVTGSDSGAYPPMSDLLQSLGIAIDPFAEHNLQPAPDLVIVGNAISRGNVEVEYVLEHRLPFTSMAQVLHEEFLFARRSLVVAGTHGKTTTSSMLAWILAVAAEKDPRFAPSFLIGGVAENFGTSFRWLDSVGRSGEQYFVIEGDEYDTAFFDKGPKFMHYFPQSMILTSVEFDHADIYGSLEEVKTAFKRLVNLVPRNGRVVAYGGHANVSECVAKAFCAVERYGFDESCAWQIRDLRQGEDGSHWQIFRNGKHWADVAMPLAGEHNVLNATAAAALAAGEGVLPEDVVRALKTFRSVKRRMEVIARVNGVTIVDDFAHHPTAIRETLRAMRSRFSLAPAHSGGRLWAVLEPRSNTLRRNVFESELCDSLALADRVVLADVFRAAAIPEAERLHPGAVVERLNAQGTPAILLADADAIIEWIAPQLASGDVVAILSNGGFGNIYQKLPDRLRRVP